MLSRALRLCALVDALLPEGESLRRLTYALLEELLGDELRARVRAEEQARAPAD